MSTPTPPPPTPDTAHGLAEVQRRIARTCARAGRSTDGVCLVAVSKTKPAAAVETLIRLGQRDFGENKVQEAEQKFPALLEQHANLRLHLIGPLQTNKVKPAMRLAHSIHSLDRPKLIDAVARSRDQLDRCPALFVQVNIGAEPQKAGVLPSELAKLLAHMATNELTAAGLMCIPPAGQPPAGHFAFLAALGKRHGVTGLSMGMSGDYEAAVELGASHVRVGSALFGARG